MTHLKRVHRGFDKEAAKLYFKREQLEREKKKEDEVRRQEDIWVRSMSWGGRSG